jgi:hypothetical protein
VKGAVCRRCLNRTVSAFDHIPPALSEIDSPGS